MSKAESTVIGHFGRLIAFGAVTIALMFALMFIIILPLFQQLFGEIVYIKPDTVWIFGLIAILFTFVFSFGMNYWYAGRVGGLKTVGGR